MNFKKILISLIAAAFAVLIASNTASGIYYNNVEALVVTILLLGIFNIFLKPLLMLFSLPFILLTFGLGIWIINAVLFLLVAFVVNGFYVESFFSALWGGFVLGIINLIAAICFGDPKEKGKFTVKINRSVRFSSLGARAGRENILQQPKKSIKNDDVIDI